MGLRTASARHSHVVVMAPALTEATQSQTFDLAPKTDLRPASPVNNFSPNSKYQVHIQDSTCKTDRDICLSNEYNHSNEDDLIHETVIQGRASGKFSAASENCFTSASISIMNNCPLPMGDLQQENLKQDKMGLQNTGLDAVTSIVKDKTATPDVEQLLNTISTSDIMQVISSMDVTSDQVPNESEEVFPIQGTELSALSSFEKDLLSDVDMMNISIEEQQDQQDQMESHSKDMMIELKKRQAKVERRLEFLRRRVLKLQARCMGQHVSGEVAGVYEYIHRTLKRLKDASSHESTKQSNPDLAGNYHQSLTMTTTEITSAEKLEPISHGATKTLARKLETSAILQANTASRQRHTSKYFGSGSVDPPSFRTSVNSMLTVPPWRTEHKQELQKVAGSLHTELRVVQDAVDSEATESSSGGESCDEMQVYNNPHQQYLSIQKRALWKYSNERAAIASRWTWLRAQIADLEYRIRQHTELHRQIRAEKGAVTLGGASPPPLSVPSSPTAVNGYRGQLPGNSSLSAKTEETTVNGTYLEYSCARTRPLNSFKKRKLLQTYGLHVVSKKAARSSTVKCQCVAPVIPCAICTGRTDPTHPRDAPEILSRQEKIALLDPCYHPVFSMPEDVSEAIHLEAIMKTNEWQQRSSRLKAIKVLSKADRLDKASSEIRSNKLDHRKKYNRLLKPSTVSALSAKIKNKIRGRKAGRHPSINRLHRKRHTAKVAMAQMQAMATETPDEEVESIGNNSSNATRSVDSPSSSPLLHMQSISGYNRKNRINSYDIDNIVIPYSVAASTRVEKLQYKEILTPKWRIADPDFAVRCDNKNNGEVRNPSQDQDSDAEDLSDESVIIRHEKSEHDEKKKFLSYLKLPLGYGRSRSNRRTDSRAESSGANTPDPLSPHQLDHHDNTNSPMTSPPATPLSMHTEDSTPLPSVSVMRRRTMSQCRLKDKDIKDESTGVPTEHEEVAPYELRTFPLSDETYEKMLKSMPENQQLQTNARAQDSREFASPISYLDERVDSPGSESTESALGDEDPNDPEWIEVERSRERHKR